ncbi:hypothetical protein K457DRAFT_75794 [Linnemannia elongata AG-77]|uniref:Uncharacterized protein n=1 Tax=Linnemannia elongata AG-77 TaxID=1314771 RepID=A0A197JWI6_9FUNG|nr:hypothetical protein K457DRAFT_75794 [Linnemannia elongata AG-77]
MHLDHAIPWITISKLFSVRQNDKPLPAQDGTLRFAEDLNPCNKPNQDKELLYFSNAIANVIKEFSTTERKKYPVQFPAESSGELFPYELLQKRHASNQEYAAHGDTYLTEQNQRLEYWIRRAHGEREPDTSLNPSKTMFSCFDLDLADAVKILIIENHMPAVLTLARHPLIPLNNLDSIGWGHSFGIDHLEYYCLRSYVYLNILAEFPEWCQNEKYRKLEAFQRLESLMTSTCDGDGQMPMHRSFFCDLNEEGQFVPRDIFADMGRMKEYLKLCFAVLYRYDMVAKEYGREHDWLRAIADALGQLHVNISHYYW